MADLFHKALVLSETVVGSLLDTRSVILFKQPDIDLNQARSAVGGFNMYGTEPMSNGDVITQYLSTLELEELFTGIGVPYLSDINGFNMFGASYLQAEVSITSDLCQHPIETGQVVTDAAIINPIAATVRIAVPTAFYTQIYKQIATLFKDKSKIILQTRFAVYRNMVITALPYKLETANVDRTPIDIKLEQVLEVEPQYTDATSDTNNNISPNKAINPADSDTADLGRVTAIEQVQGA